jgi:hypothetical protein
LHGGDERDSPNSSSGTPNTAPVADPLQHGQRGLDLRRVDVHAPRDPMSALAIDDPQVSVVVEVADVAQRPEAVVLELAACLVVVRVGEVRNRRAACMG